MPKSENTGWYLSDTESFSSGYDRDEQRGGTESVFLESKVKKPKTFGFLSKTISPTPFLGKRLKFLAWVKTSLSDNASVQLWLRADGDWKIREGCYDNMYQNRIRGVSDWCKYEVTVDVPEGTSAIVYGVLLNGTGRLLINDVSLDTVSDPANSVTP